MNYAEYLLGLYRPPLEKTNREEYVCLDKNEPPFSAFDTIENMFDDNDMKMLRVYPDLYSLYEKLADFVGVGIHNLLITQGSEQALKYVFEVFVEEGDEVVYYNPSFAMYDVFSFLKKASIKYIEFHDDATTNVGDILKAVTDKTRLFSLINPHNFTGTMFQMDEIYKIAEHMEKTNTIFLLDEAYFHYVELDTKSLLSNFSNIIITRTFSKALGIPGARVGYAISTPENIELLRKFKPIDEIDYLAGTVAKKVLDNAKYILDKNVNQVKKWQKIFKQSDIDGIEYIDTNANFILLRSLNYEFHKNLLLSNKFLIKYDFKQDCLKNCIRFSIVDDINMEKILNLLQKGMDSL